MKRINFFFGLLAVVLMVSCNNTETMEYPLTIDKPFVTYSNISSITVAKIELTDSATTLKIHAVYSSGSTVRFDKNTHLVTDAGIELPILSSEGIELDSWFNMPESGESDFTFTFGPMPKDAKFFDFIECDGDNCFNFYGIYFSDKPRIDMPKEWSNLKYEEEELPASVVNKDSTIINGLLLGYRPEMAIELTLYYAPFGKEQKDIAVPVDENGKFKVVVTPFMPTKAYLVMQRKSYQVLLVPGQNISMMIDLTKTSDPNYPPDFNGSLAKINHDINAISEECPRFSDFVDYEALKDQSVEVVIDMVDKTLQSLCDSIEKLDIGKASKQYCTMNAEIQYYDFRLNYSRFYRNHCMEEANVYSQETYMAFIQQYVAPSEELQAALKENLSPSKFIEERSYSLYGGALSLYDRNKDFLPNVANRDHAEAINAYHLLMKYDRGDELSDDEIKEFETFKNPVYKELIEERIAERKAKEEKLKQMKSVHIHELDEIVPEKTLETILEAYKGKAVFFDIWATWCGPCKAAHKTILPLKEELKGKDVVFVYLTGPTSPLDKWTDMIPEITGEHYYLTKEQYQTIMKQYESQGVPTYLIFNTAGEFVYKSVGFPGNDTMKTQLLNALEK